MQSGSQGWEKGGKARQDANMTNNQPAGNLLIRVSKGASLFSHFSSVSEFEFFQRVGFLTDSQGSSPELELLKVLTLSFAWISRSFLRASTWMWELTWIYAVSFPEILFHRQKQMQFWESSTILRKFSPFFSSGKYSCNCGLQIQILSNGDLLACSRLARSKLDVPGYQLVPS